PLKTNKTPSENAQAYFTKYQKAKNAVEAVNEQIKRTHEEIAYFEELIQQLSSASPKDLEEMREELVEGKYLRAKQKRHAKKKKPAAIQLETYESS
ncbi:NFACT family protein, partial [Bacillus sp. WOD8 KX774193]